MPGTKTSIINLGIMDFMYYGEAAVPTHNIERFLGVAEQFQVRGLVEDVPKVTIILIFWFLMFPSCKYFSLELCPVAGTRPSDLE